MAVQFRTVRKVLAYVTREESGRRQLLVNVHRDQPEAGIRVPIGGWQDGETAQQAVLREVYEESGLNAVRIEAKLGRYVCYYAPRRENHERHIFWLSTRLRTPDSWDHTHCYVWGGDSVVLTHRWVDLAPGIPLEAGQGDLLHAIANNRRATAQPHLRAL